mmetsp:Transcript_26780/g.40848  ORF Transcript_26780/g.40848 Transcript_26780/m.40848 type:complete len:83 (+) Transcript_26780:453-701(+)
MGAVSGNRLESFTNILTKCDPSQASCADDSGFKYGLVVASSLFWDADYGELRMAEQVLSAIPFGKGLNYYLTLYAQENRVET